MRKVDKEIEEVLKAPYSRIVIPDPESGTFTARIAEFPGCIAQGETAEEAHRNLEAAARDWVKVAWDMGQQLPEPFEERSFSGRVLVRFPSSIHRRASELARRENTSLNQLIVSAVSELVGGADVSLRMIQEVERHLETSRPSTLPETRHAGIPVAD